MMSAVGTLLGCTPRGDRCSPTGESHLLKDTERRSADRSACARRKQSLLARPDWIAHIISQSKSLANSLEQDSTQTLRVHADQLRYYRRGGMPIADDQLLTLATAAVRLAVQRSLGLTLFDVQIHAGLIVSFGAVAQMQTGEGKTLAGILPAFLHSLIGRGVHVATTNDYLASRDHDKLSPVMACLGVTTGLLAPNATANQTRAAYQADVTYGTGHAFGFDYLRDQLTLHNTESDAIGTSLLQAIESGSCNHHLRQRGLHCAIVDEIDHVLIDDAVSPLLLSSASQDEAPDAEIHRAANKLAGQMRPSDEFTIADDDSSLSLTDKGYDRIYDGHSMAVHDCLVRPWHEYALLALRARHLMKRDVHYVVRDQSVQIVDSSTGRIFADRSWSDGLQQAVQTAENLTITPEADALAKMTRQRFYRYYPVLGGMSGTAMDCQAEFAKVYGLSVNAIPTRLTSVRRIDPDVILDREAEKYAAIARDTQQIHQTRRPILIGTLDIQQSLSIAAALQQQGLDFQLLNGVQDADEAALIAKAGQCGAITVATNMAGRGTDIQLEPHAKQLGGLHVIVVERHSLARVDRQLIGRCARCGDPGSATFYLSADDSLPSRFAPWIANAIRRDLITGRLNRDALTAHLLAAQKTQQRRATAARMKLLIQDRENENVLQRQRGTANLDGCWQL